MKTMLLFAFVVIAFLVLKDAQVTRVNADPMPAIQINTPTPVVPAVDAQAPLTEILSRESCAGKTHDPVEGWEPGVGGKYPPCWYYWNYQQRVEFTRSH